MEKLKMQTANLADEKYRKLVELFPEAVTETTNENGEIVRAIDKDVLMQEISTRVVEGREERYQFTWPDKRKAVIAANAPSTCTLRPCREESVDFDNTQNLYIEGDNLEVLKLLKENYLGKVKMIYIDPPYNTGNDFVYEDDFAETTEEYRAKSGEYDEEGNRLFQNTDSNGRFHTDWLNMIYPRLKLARNLLAEDGVVFISIDDNEVDNLKKVCDEIFGAINFRNTIALRRRIKSLNVQFADNGLDSLNVGFEYVLVYAKPIFKMKPIRAEKRLDQQSDEGKWQGFWSNADRPTMRYEVLGFTPIKGQWRKQKDYAERAVKNYQNYLSVKDEYESLEDYYHKTGICEFIRRDIKGKGENGGVYHWQAPDNTTLRTTNWLDIEVSQIIKEIKLPFDNPKNVKVPKELMKLADVKSSDIVLDFFSGSATTAHAVMQLNAEDGGNRRFIMVQLPEQTDEKSEAYKAGYKNICEIGKERIRRAGKKIEAENPLTTQDLDTGFRVLKLDSSNMQDVFYTPEELLGNRTLLDSTEGNIKEDRTTEDLLFQVMLEFDIPLSAKVECKKIDGHEVWSVDNGYLMACFDAEITDKTITAIAKEKPYYFAMRDSSLADDSVAVNYGQIFNSYSPDTHIKVL